MYTQLLEAALGALDPPDDDTTGAVLADLLQRRRRLPAGASVAARSDWTTESVADQVAYDVALMRLCRRLEIGCDTRAFDRPQQERDRLEQALASRGVFVSDLAEHDGHVEHEDIASGPTV